MAVRQGSEQGQHSAEQADVRAGSSTLCNSRCIRGAAGVMGLKGNDPFGAPRLSIGLFFSMVYTFLCWSKMLEKVDDHEWQPREFDELGVLGRVSARSCLHLDRPEQITSHARTQHARTQGQGCRERTRPTHHFTWYFFFELLFNKCIL